ncbi:hypothetical protein Leryth_001755 [Lithospermum erythrorhizon]|nr:hypothetical protein Leryth_001755 [Lithospermum erythrorhizon]
MAMTNSNNNKKFSFSFLVIAMNLFNSTLAGRPTYNVLSYGAKGDGGTDSTNAFLSAWAATCNSTKPSTMYVPRGKFLLRNVAFWGQTCKNTAIKVQIDGTLVAPSNYNVIGNTGCWIKFSRVNGVSISGGILDGRGTNLWACKTSGKSCPGGATTLGVYNSKNVEINKLTSLNSQLFHVIVYGSQNVRVQGVKITASGTSPNTDGIHIQGSSYVTVSSTKIATGDDCVSIGPGSTNLWIENVVCGPGHGISIGSLGWDKQEPGVQNVTVTTSTFIGTTNGLRVKTWARESNGFVKDVLFQHAVMKKVQNPILIDQNYCPHGSCPHQGSSVRISGIKFLDVHGTSATQVAIKIDCSKNVPCSGIKLQDVNLEFKSEAVPSASAQALCSNAGGTSSGYMQPRGCL